MRPIIVVSGQEVEDGSIYIGLLTRIIVLEAVGDGVESGLSCKLASDGAGNLW